jgi:hypothetical protein
MASPGEEGGLDHRTDMAVSIQLLRTRRSLAPAALRYSLEYVLGMVG